MRIEVIHPNELGAGERAQWRAHRNASRSLTSPFLTPEWAEIVGRFRDDARVCVIDEGRGFLGVERPSRFAAMGLGAPIADYQGVVGEAGLELDRGKLCRALGVGRIDLTHVPTDQTILSRPAGEEGAWIVDVSAGLEAYRAQQRQTRKEFLRQTEKKERKLVREHGALTFTAFSKNEAHFEIMLFWKLRQLARSGQPAIWSKPWVRRVLDATFAANDPNLSGALFTLTIGERLLAAAYFLRAERVLHAWIVAHDNEFDAYSPGVLLARWAIEHAAANAFAEVDFGPGDYQYKRQLATGQRMIAWGAVSRLSWSAAVRHTQFAVRAGLEKLPQKQIASLPGKAMRRLDLMRGLAA